MSSQLTHDQRGQLPPPPTDDYDGGNGGWDEELRALEHRILNYCRSQGVKETISRTLDSVQEQADKAAARGELDKAQIFSDRCERLRSLQSEIARTEHQTSIRAVSAEKADQLLDNVVSRGVMSLDQLSQLLLGVASDDELAELAERVDRLMPPAWIDAMVREGRALLQEHQRPLTPPDADLQSAHTSGLRTTIAANILRELRSH